MVVGGSQRPGDVVTMAWPKPSVKRSLEPAKLSTGTLDLVLHDWRKPSYSGSMLSLRETVLAEIEAFLVERDITATTFGVRAMNDEAHDR